MTYRPLLAEPNDPDLTEAELTAAREHLADDVLTGGPNGDDVLSENDHEELWPLLVAVRLRKPDAAHDLVCHMKRIVAAHFAHPDQEDAVRLRAFELREDYAESMAEEEA